MHLVSLATIEVKGEREKKVTNKDAEIENKVKEHFFCQNKTE